MTATNWKAVEENGWGFTLLGCNLTVEIMLNRTMRIFLLWYKFKKPDRFLAY
jgi:hypothetical protein